MIPGIIAFYSVIYSAARSIKMPIIKKQGTQLRNNLLSVRADGFVE